MQSSISFPDTAKVFIYQADRPLTEAESAQLLTAAEKFAANWMSHGQPVRAQALLLNQSQLVFIVDESSAQVGGCSIDGNVHFVKECGTQLGVDFFNRMVLAFETTNGFKLVHYNDVAAAFARGELDANSRLFDNTVTTFSQWTQNWLKPLQDTWLSKSIGA